MARPEKAAAVQEITERFEGAEATLLTEYRGLRVAEIAEVRGALREADAEYKVLKNTLARIAVREVGLDELVDMLEGPTAVVFVKGDVAAAAKALDDAAKKYPVLVVKGGALKGRVFGADQAKVLANLEPREVLLAKIAMMVNSPAQQTVNVLSALLRNLGSMLAQVVTQKEAEGPAPAAQDAGADAEAEAEAPEPTTDPAEGGEGEPQEGAPQPSTDPAEGPDDASASADAGGPAEDAASEAAAEADAGETPAEEPPPADDPAAEAAEEASAGEAAAPISSSDESGKEEEE